MSALKQKPTNKGRTRVSAPTKMDNTTQIQPKKRPTGMTILLVLSFLNAFWNIISSLVMYLMSPIMVEMMKNGQVEGTMAPYSALLGEEQMQMAMDGMKIMAQIDPKYWLFQLILFVGSLVGVIRMFKGNKTGLHIYAVSQILMLINASVYLYPKQPQSNFASELLLTLIFILLYYLYFKRMETSDNLPQNLDQP